MSISFTWKGDWSRPDVHRKANYDIGSCIAVMLMGPSCEQGQDLGLAVVESEHAGVILLRIGQNAHGSEVNEIKKDPQVTCRACLTSPRRTWPTSPVFQGRTHMYRCKKENEIEHLQKFEKTFPPNIRILAISTE